METIKEMFDYIEKRARELVNYSDKLRENFESIDSAFYGIFKDAGVFYTDTEPIDNDDYVDIYLRIGKDSRGYWGFLYGNEYFNKPMTEQSRYLIKKTIVRLPTFLQGYIEKLDRTTEEYKKASELAEAMNNAINKLVIEE